MDDFGVARAGFTANDFMLFKHHNFPTVPRKFSSDSEPYNASPDDDAFNLIQSAYSQRILGTCSALLPRSALREIRARAVLVGSPANET